MRKRFLAFLMKDHTEKLDCPEEKQLFCGNLLTMLTNFRVGAGDVRVKEPLSAFLPAFWPPQERSSPVMSVELRMLQWIRDAALALF